MRDPLPFLRPGKLAILLFHGVIRDPGMYQIRNYTGKHMPLDAFERMMRSLKAVARPFSLDQWLEVKTPPGEKCFAITFDDGFENNCSVAAPVLVRLGIPATFYVATGLVEHNGMSWIDRIELAFENAGRGRTRLPGERVTREYSSPSEAIAILTEIRRIVKSMPSLNPENAVKDIISELAQPEVTSSRDPLDLKMTWEQVREMHEHPLFTIGGHSHSHPVLSHLDDERLHEEIALSIRLLCDKAGIFPLRHYSYPEGLAHHFDERVIRELKAAGITCCPTAIEGLNEPGDDPFHLKRILIS